jgi:glycosyltransferase involved in cell wall biosynthesis
MGDVPDLSIVVPVYNEEDNVAVLNQELVAVLEPMGMTWEIVYVDDGSRDRTFERLAQLHAAEPRVRVVKFRRNFGQTAAMQAGFDLSRGRVVVTMDGDLQNDPKDIPRLVAGIHGGSDVVVGWRKSRKDKLISRKIPSWCANWLIAKATGIHIHDNGCSLKAYRREVLERTSLYGEMHRFIPAMMSMAGSSVLEMAVHHRPRRFGQSKYGISRTLRVASDLLVVKMLTTFANRSTHWFATASLPFLALALVFLILSAFRYLQAWDGRATPPIVFPGVALLSAFAALHLLLLGMLGELVVRTGNHHERDSILVIEEGEGA